MLRNRTSLGDRTSSYGNTTTIRTFSFPKEPGIRLEQEDLKLGGTRLSGLLKVFHVSHSQSGLLLEIDFQLEFVSRVGESLKVVCFVGREKSRDHIFFACPFTFTIWTTLTVNLLRSSASPDWVITVRSLLRQRRNKLDYRDNYYSQR